MGGGARDGVAGGGSRGGSGAVAVAVAGGPWRRKRSNVQGDESVREGEREFASFS